MNARWSERGLWQTFAIESYGGRVIYSGDAVFLKAHTGKMLEVQGVAVQARWHDYGHWQKLIIEKDGSGPILPGDSIFLRAHTGNMLEVQGQSVRARWSERGVWQTLVVEKMTSRRLNLVDSSSLASSIVGVSAATSAVAILTIGLALALLATLLSQAAKVCQFRGSCKVQLSSGADEGLVSGLHTCEQPSPTHHAHAMAAAV